MTDHGLGGAVPPSSGSAIPDEDLNSVHAQYAGQSLSRTPHSPDISILAPGQHTQTIGCLAKQDLHVRATYQPNSRYWPFQLIGTGIFLAAAAVLSGLCFWRIRRTD